MARTIGDRLWKSLAQQLLVNQAQRCREKGCFPQLHFLDMVCEQFGVLLGEIPTKELNLHFHYSRMTTGDQRVRKNKRERLLNIEYPPGGK